MKLILFIMVLSGIIVFAQNKSPKPHYNIFAFNKEVKFPGTSEQIIDSVTGDIIS